MTTDQHSLAAHIGQELPTLTRTPYEPVAPDEILDGHSILTALAEENHDPAQIGCVPILTDHGEVLVDVDCVEDLSNEEIGNALMVAAAEHVALLREANEVSERFRALAAILRGRRQEVTV